MRMGFWLLDLTIPYLLGVFSKLCYTVLYDFECSLEGLPIYILWNCQFPSQNWSLKRNDGYYRMLVSSMKFTCCLHNIRIPRSNKCRTSKRLAVIFLIRIYSEFRRDLFSANAMYICMVSFFFRLAGNTAINFTRILTRPTTGTYDVSEVWTTLDELTVYT